MRAGESATASPFYIQYNSLPSIASLFRTKSGRPSIKVENVTVALSTPPPPTPTIGCFSSSALISSCFVYFLFLYTLKVQQRHKPFLCQPGKQDHHDRRLGVLHSEHSLPRLRRTEGKRERPDLPPGKGAWACAAPRESLPS